MPDSTQNPEARSEDASNTEDDVPATLLPPTASSAHEGATETSQIQVVSANSPEKPLPIPTPEMLRPTKTVECNMMGYTDDGGVARQIYMPKGTAALARDLFQAKRFSDLAKFPAWDNQNYDDWEADEERYAYLNEELGDSASRST
ncbi:hypothetical protein KVR01_008426 [Diaporthe batatas]|uniref:uncharacterized protein n=1 Tax=Diaporthe batatas TaxID=748121 RepID=UPI001D03D471|nr:uncharacterized protein KVR01_008426 [Diaporthe batatas]KAG8161439.1 hypothetical protein KVR01_008426 [Diaporthe batatas]